MGERLIGEESKLVRWPREIQRGCEESGDTTGLLLRKKVLYSQTFQHYQWECDLKVLKMILKPSDDSSVSIVSEDNKNQLFPWYLTTTPQSLSQIDIEQLQAEESNQNSYSGRTLKVQQSFFFRSFDLLRMLSFFVSSQLNYNLWRCEKWQFRFPLTFEYRWWRNSKTTRVRKSI